MSILSAAGLMKADTLDTISCLSIVVWKHQPKPGVVLQRVNLYLAMWEKGT